MVRRGPMRPGRAGFLLGLVLLITAHLSGAVHASSFTGPLVTVEAAASAQPPAGCDRDHDETPGHEHRAGDHIDHAADRPRTSVDETVVESAHADPAVSPPDSADTTLMPAVRDRPPSAVACAADGRGALTLHCVWRQQAPHARPTAPPASPWRGRARAPSNP